MPTDRAKLAAEHKAGLSPGSFIMRYFSSKDGTPIFEKFVHIQDILDASGLCDGSSNHQWPGELICGST